MASADLVLASVDRQGYVDAVIDRQDEAAACQIVLEAVQRLERAGCDFYAICCNDAHRFVPAVAERVALPCLHIAEVTARAAASQAMTHVALTGVAKTMEEPFYREALASHGIQTPIPEREERAWRRCRRYALTAR